MSTQTRTILGALLAVPLFACGGGGGGADGGAAGGDGSAAGRGSATLTIGSMVWEFDNFRCAQGAAQTQSAIYSFNSDSRGVHTDGHRVQMQTEIRDESGADRLVGDGVIYEIYINDIMDFENPTVDWSSRSTASVLHPSGETIVRVDGRAVTAEGLFHDRLNETDPTQIAGTVVGTCAP